MTDRPISAVIEHTVTTTKGGGVERITTRVNGALVLDSDKVIDLDSVAHFITHAEAFLRELITFGGFSDAGDHPRVVLSDRDHARAAGHADELAHALRLISGVTSP